MLKKSGKATWRGVKPEWDVEEEFCHLDKLQKAFQAGNKSQREARAEAGASGREQNQVTEA